jgi:hypothetical protein
MVEEVAVSLPTPVNRPNTIGAALQNVLPMDHLTDTVAKPPGPYASLHLREFRPVPPRAPLPDRHTLPVRCEVVWDGRQGLRLTVLLMTGPVSVCAPSFFVCCR